ncbi:Predicted transcriptional regulator [Kingella denitrificans]|uniref:DNA-binding helix-turn-helix protein n=1 Tax=Kingella denitrificans ATCC 33394 TaxID=888741 RepID=F0EWF0_9NEIS|nr:helix-turn-helix transcriptional regulator [Kingella denitrificans]EGC18378.1 DNA-binding helix-turn-helix protein [Kingella denitrificans ATCC 33394]QQB42980.1 helix-turn-helix transcriptional regulator [Kingella denitrificans]STR11035.1 Predicted transcriptional regulator [Kingella denitrificans]
MKTYEKIRLIREIKQWSQEQMAEKLEMSANGYAKIERGETKLTLPRLQKIADIFEMNLNELAQENEQSFMVVIGENSTYCTNIHTSISSGKINELIIEIEKLKLMLAHKDELLAQKERELIAKEEIIALLKQ